MKEVIYENNPHYHDSHDHVKENKTSITMANEDILIRQGNRNWKFNIANVINSDVIMSDDEITIKQVDRDWKLRFNNENGLDIHLDTDTVKTLNGMSGEVEISAENLSVSGVGNSPTISGELFDLREYSDVLSGILYENVEFAKEISGNLLETQIYAETLSGDLNDYEIYANDYLTSLSGGLKKNFGYNNKISGDLLDTQIYAEAISGDLLNTQVYAESVSGNLLETQIYAEAISGNLLETQVYAETTSGELLDTKKRINNISGFVNTVSGDLLDTQVYSETVSGDLLDTLIYAETISGDLLDTQTELTAVSGVADTIKNTFENGILNLNNLYVAGNSYLSGEVRIGSPNTSGEFTEIFNVRDPRPGHPYDAANAKFVSESVAKIINGAPDTFDTLQEIAEFISSHGLEYQDLLGRMMNVETYLVSTRNEISGMLDLAKTISGDIGKYSGLIENLVTNLGYLDSISGSVEDLDIALRAEISGISGIAETALATAASALAGVNIIQPGIIAISGLLNSTITRVDQISGILDDVKFYAETTSGDLFAVSGAMANNIQKTAIISGQILNAQVKLDNVSGMAYRADSTSISGIRYSNAISGYIKTLSGYIDEENDKIIEELDHISGHIYIAVDAKINAISGKIAALGLTDLEDKIADVSGELVAYKLAIKNAVQSSVDFDDFKLKITNL